MRVIADVFYEIKKYYKLHSKVVDQQKKTVENNEIEPWNMGETML